MKFLITVFVSFLLSITAYAQSENSELTEIDSLYIKTIQSQYFFLQNCQFYVETNQKTERIKKVDELNYLKFMTNIELIKESLKTKRTLDVIRINDRCISKDTLDINIGCLRFKAKRRIHFNHGLKFIKVNSILACSGTKGFTPTCRFLYKNKKKRWVLFEE
ncbi:hypothetical protein DMA11_22620 [Marinilabiliaceae bacterium JC017]|nr:hypothetical protein DMA11_22620 [Marinilabiliaceae bacterium JC017]